MGVTDHHAQSAGQGAVPLAIVTVSDTRTPETDVSGQTIRELVTAAGHMVVDYRIVKDEPDQVLQVLEDFSAGAARIIIFNGGTGIGRRDRTYDVISKSLDKTLPGFGEIFRLLSYQEIGAAAMLTACHRRRLPGQGHLQHARLSPRRSPGRGKVDPARDSARRVGVDPLKTTSRGPATACGRLQVPGTSPVYPLNSGATPRLCRLFKRIAERDQPVLAQKIAQQRDVIGLALLVIAGRHADRRKARRRIYL